jgi:hypothetical protein
MQLKTAKPAQIKPNRRGLYTPEPVRGRVLVRHMNGASNREMARVEGIDRSTVGRILSQQEVVNLTAQNQSRLLNLVPRAIEVCEQALDSDDERLATATATKILENLQVLGSLDRAIEIANQVSPEAEQRRQRILMFGEFTDELLNKCHRQGITIPPEYGKMEEEVNKRMEQPGSNGGAAIAEQFQLKP